MGPEKSATLPYLYKPLEQDEIRVLALYPGPFGTQLRGEVIHVNLLSSCSDVESDGDIGPEDRSRRYWGRICRNPSYRAISYAWGDSTFLHTISIGQSETLGLTDSLYHALQHFRSVDRTRHMWADAVCINQCDDQERSTQAAMMADIFAAAVEVLAWLGLSIPSDGIAFNTIRRCTYISEQERLLRILATNDARRRDTIMDCLIAPNRNLIEGEPIHAVPNILMAIYSSIDRPWFTRMWIAQEARASSRVWLHSGEHTASLAALETLVAMLDPGQMNRDFDLELTSEQIQELRIRIQRVHPTRFEDQEQVHNSVRFVWQNISALSQRKCKNSRDRVYAVRKLLTLEDEPLLIPNYALSTTEVFARFTLVSFGGYFLNHGRIYGLYARPWVALSIAQAVVTRNAVADDDAEERTLPSWVVDLAGFTSSTQNKVEFCIQRPDHKTQFGTSVQHFDHRVHESEALALQVRGRCFAKVIKFFGLSEPSDHPQASMSSHELLLHFFATLHDHVLCILNSAQPLRLSQLTELIYSDEYRDPRESNKIDSHGSLQDTDTPSERDFGQFKDALRDICEPVIDMSNEVQYEQELHTLCRFLLSKTIHWFKSDRRILSDSGRVMALVGSDNRYDLGWVPSRTVVGDDLCIVNRAPYPYVLREVRDSYVLIGEACSIRTKLVEALTGQEVSCETSITREKRLFIDDSGQYRIIYADVAKTSKLVGRRRRPTIAFKHRMDHAGLAYI